jgi:mannose/fructose/N-acetylgalactosamine-specific phosphotransferase system component IIC
MLNMLNKFLKTLSSPKKIFPYWAAGFACFAFLTVLLYILPLNSVYASGHALVAALICLFGMAFNQTLIWLEEKKANSTIDPTTTKEEE